MPKTKRDYLKRKVAQAHYQLEKAYLPIAELEMTFRETHADLADGLVIAAQLTQDAQSMLERFAEFAWEMDIESIKKHRT